MSVSVSVWFSIHSAAVVFKSHHGMLRIISMDDPVVAKMHLNLQVCLSLCDGNSTGHCGIVHGSLSKYYMPFSQKPAKSIFQFDVQTVLIIR